MIVELTVYCTVLIFGEIFRSRKEQGISSDPTIRILPKSEPRKVNVQ